MGHFFWNILVLDTLLFVQYNHKQNGDLYFIKCEVPVTVTVVVGMCFGWRWYRKKEFLDDTNSDHEHEQRQQKNDDQTIGSSEYI